MKFQVHYQGQTTHANLQGDIVAGTGPSLARLAAQLGGSRVVIDMGLVRSCNSIGCREWAQAIGLVCAARKVDLVECPVAFIDSCNLIPMMLGPAGSRAMIKTFYAPYYCNPCSQEFTALLDAEAVRAPKRLDPKPCPACKALTKAEVEAEDYLIFLDRMPK